jgi:aryl-alcohol dehydrogenase-like predicted oxidoreductase
MSAQSDRVSLGASGITVSAVGLGTWQWGDRTIWGYGRGGFTDADIEAAFEAAVAAGTDFFDTAEIYGRGRSETLLGGAVRAHDSRVVVASKYMPFPWRLRRAAFDRALSDTLKRLGMERLDLYQIHWPMPPVPVEVWVGALGDAIKGGLARAAGVSNYGPEQVELAHEVLARRGLPLATNQVRYSLLYREPERTGLTETCRRLGVTIIAYSPLSQGLLTGKYGAGNPPPGLRRTMYGRYLGRLDPLIGLMREIGTAHGGKTPSQVALNWIVCKGAIPIPGAKNARQATDNAGAAGWRLSESEQNALEHAADVVRGA